MATSLTGSNFDGFSPVGTPEETHLGRPSQYYQRSHGKTSSSYDNGRFLHVKACSREYSQSIAMCLEMDRGHV